MKKLHKIEQSIRRFIETTKTEGTQAISSPIEIWNDFLRDYERRLNYLEDQLAHLQCDTDRDTDEYFKIAELQCDLENYNIANNVVFDMVTKHRLANPLAS